jgi:energy-coupling factor transporter ATP-binding protein EcfA2
MVEAGQPHHIKVLSVEQFTKLFFDFNQYKIAREKAPFGSSINPLTGEIDATEYVQVRYTVDGRKDDATSRDVASWLRDGRRIILLGEYGSGKSRCVREVFSHLTEGADAAFCYPMAIDLRRSWGLERGHELIRRHLTELGLPGNAENAAIRAFNSGAFAVLLDGFDEIGSQAWSNDSARLKAIRAKSLAGVKDLVRSSNAGVLISGREHYFPNSEEMFSALGLDQKSTLIIRSKDEFSDTELLEYFRKRDIDVDVPAWLPRRPLICQTISDLAAGDFETMFGDEGNEIAFWEHFVRVLCERDARIHVSFDPDTILRLFIQLARITRSKPANVGPLSLAELQSAFETVTGSAPVEEASVMLQRLPSLGRISPESNDRQFVDVYILDGLRAKDIVRSCLGSDDEFAAAASARWNNPLDDLGQRVLADDSALSDKSKLKFAVKANVAGNKVLAPDLVAALMRTNEAPFDFEGLEIDNGDFLYLALNEREVRNIKISNSYFGELALPSKNAVAVSITGCTTPRVSGVTAASALPSWIRGLEAETFDSVESVSRIRKIGLSPAHEILITIIRKTFFQKGAGRKEEALLRGLGNVASRATSGKVLNLMLKEGLLTTFRGDEGAVYAPVRSHTKRMQKILDELKGSEDEIWIKVGTL